MDALLLHALSEQCAQSSLLSQHMERLVQGTPAGARREGRMQRYQQLPAGAAAAPALGHADGAGRHAGGGAGGPR